MTEKEKYEAKCEAWKNMDEYKRRMFYELFENIWHEILATKLIYTELLCLRDIKDRALDKLNDHIKACPFYYIISTKRKNQIHKIILEEIYHDQARELGKIWRKLGIIKDEMD